MKDIIVGFCPYCGSAGLVCPALEKNLPKIVFICDECLAVFDSMEDLKSKKSRALNTQYVELTMQQAIQAGLGEYAMCFNGKKWISAVGAEVLAESHSRIVPQEKSLSHVEDLEIIRKYLIESRLKENVVNAILENFERHEDIASEFAYRICCSTTPPQCINICVGDDVFSADSLMRNYKRIATLHDAYSFLTFLKDDPDCAVKMLKKGLPIKD